MLQFMDLHLYVRAIILLFLLLLTTFNTCLLFAVIHKKDKWYKTITLSLFSIFSFVTLILFVSQNYANVFDINIQCYKSD